MHLLPEESLYRGSGGGLGALDGALELLLAHLRPPPDVQAARILQELVAGRGVAAAHRRRFLSERRTRLWRQVLEGLLALRGGLRFLDVAPGRRALLLRRHGRPVTRSGCVVSRRCTRAKGASDGTLSRRRPRPGRRGPVRGPRRGRLLDRGGARRTPAGRAGRRGLLRPAAPRRQPPLAQRAGQRQLLRGGTRLQD